MEERKGKLHTEQVEERSGLEPGPLGNKHSWEEGGNGILVPSLFVLEPRGPETPERSATWRRSRTHIPWSMCLAERGVMAYFPKEQQAPLLSCIYPSAGAGPSFSTPESLMSQLYLTPVQCQLRAPLLLD